MAIRRGNYFFTDGRSKCGWSFFAALLIQVGTIVAMTGSLSAGVAPQELVANEGQPIPKSNMLATISETFTESDVAFFAIHEMSFSDEELKKLPSSGIEVQFQVVSELKGQEWYPSEKKFKAKVAPYELKHKHFMFVGRQIQKKSSPTQWIYRTGVTSEDETYLASLFGLEAKSTLRLEFFMKALENPKDLISRDAHLEFSLASDDELIALKQKLDHDQLVKWIQKPEIQPLRAQLYGTLLSICGNVADADWIERWLSTEVQQPRAATTAMIACYLSLEGERGMPFIRQTILDFKSDNYLDVSATIQVLRHLGNAEDSRIPRKQVVEALRLVLERPKMADLVISDLIRYEDWESMDRIAELYKEADDESPWVRVPAYMFMLKCPREEAKNHLVEFGKIDPHAKQRAEFFSFDANKVNKSNDGVKEKIEARPASRFFRPIGRRPWRKFLC